MRLYFTRMPLLHLTRAGDSGFCGWFGGRVFVRVASTRRKAGAYALCSLALVKIRLLVLARPCFSFLRSPSTPGLSAFVLVIIPDTTFSNQQRTNPTRPTWGILVLNVFSKHVVCRGFAKGARARDRVRAPVPKSSESVAEDALRDVSGFLYVHSVKIVHKWVSVFQHEKRVVNVS